MDFLRSEFLEHPDHNPELIIAHRWIRTGMERRSWYVKDWAGIPGPSHLSWDYAVVTDRRASNTHVPIPEASLWGDFGRAARSEERDGAGIEDARGWPQLAFWCTIVAKGNRFFGPRSTTAEGGIQISATDGSVSPGDFRVIPLRPIWRGVFINTAFYTPFWLILLLGCPAARAWHRLRHGLCRSCAYDLRGDLAAGCPECGWRR
jgi:hypothetical protein